MKSLQSPPLARRMAEATHFVEGIKGVFAGSGVDGLNNDEV
jgi:hypothetical protein